MQHFLKRGMLMLCLFAGMQSMLLGQTQTFNVSGTFTVPHKVTSVKAELWGGGGGGGYQQTNNKRGAAGGGGGAFSQKNTITVTSGTSYSVVVGTGGQGASNSLSASNGGQTSFNGITANGGGAGSGHTAGVGGIAGSNGDINFAGGSSVNSSSADELGGSGGGASANSQNNGANGAASQDKNLGGAGGTGVSGGGSGGGGGSKTNSGAAGSLPGGGGGGRGPFDNITIGSGGAGASGQVILTWSCATTLTSSAGTNNQSFACPGTPIANITYEITGAYGAVFSGLPPGVTGVYTNGDVVISGTPLSGGTFNYTITPSGSCTSNTASGTITVGGTVAGSVSGSNPTITLGNSTGVLTLTGHSGTILKWQKKRNNNAYTDLGNTSTTYSETPAVTGIWRYRAVLQASGGCSESYSIDFVINVGTSLRTQTFTTTSTFTVPHKTNSIKAELWGGGGGGGSVDGKKPGGGGGGGAFTQKNSIAVTSGANISVTVGAGGQGSLNGAGGTAGGQSSFSGVTANGGAVINGSKDGAAGGAAGTTGDINFAGGNGGTATNTDDHGGAGGGASGNNGGNGGSGLANSNATGGAGGVGLNGGGSGGAGGNNDNSGNNGNVPGGGGGGEGGDKPDQAGAGGSGQVILTWPCITTLYSAPGTDNQKVCLGNAMTTIHYEVYGDTNVV